MSKQAQFLLVALTLTGGIFVWRACRSGGEAPVSREEGERPAVGNASSRASRQIAGGGSEGTMSSGRVSIRDRLRIKAPTPHNLSLAAGRGVKTPISEEEEKAAEEAEFADLQETALNDPDPDERAFAVGHLPAEDASRIAPILSRALRDPNSDVRIEAVHMLGDLEERVPVDLLSVAITDRDPDVRREAIDVIGNVADDDTMRPRVQVLINLALGDGDEDVQAKARDIAGIEDEDSSSDSD